MTPPLMASRRLRMLLAAGLGAGAAFGLAPWGLWPLALVGFAAVVPLVARESAGGAARIGWAFGAGYFGHALIWIVEPFMVDVARHGWMAPFALVFMAGGLALFWGAAFWAAVRLAAPGWGRVVLLTACWAAAEALRGVIFTGFPWAAPGQIWVDTPVAALLAWVGPEGLNLLTLLAFLPLGLLVGRHWLGVAPAVVCAGMAVVAARAVPEVVETGKVVRIVQPNVPQEEKWDIDRARDAFARQVAYTAAEPRPDLVVWPETALQTLLERAGPALETVGVAAGGAQVAVGLLRRDGDKYYNTLVRLDGTGALDGVYDKHHLVPFGEYVPLTGLAERFGISGLADTFGGGFSAGPGPRLMGFGDLGQALPLICYEAVFAQDVGDAPGRPDFLLQITNDAWFGTTIGPYQHLAQARMRAIEQGLPLVRSANTGVSAMIAPDGTVTKRLSLGEAGFIDAGLPAPFAPTLYARTGDKPALILVLVLILGGIAHILRAKRALPD